MGEAFTHLWQALIGRVHGPFAFRLVLQPLTAIIIACRAGWRDAKAGRPAYGWAVLSNRAERLALLKEGWRELTRVFIVAVIVDLIYEVVAFREFRLGQSLIVAAVLALLPYPLFRGTFNRIVRSCRGTEKRGPFLNIPESVSEEAQEFLRSLRNPASMPAFPNPGDLDGWRKLQSLVEGPAKAQSEEILQRYAPAVIQRVLGSINVLEVCPKGWHGSRCVAVYVHGGAHTLYSAASTAGRAAMFAHDTGLRVISVDYTLAPFAKYDQMSDQVVAVVQALLSEGHALEEMILYGESSGGGLAASAILKMRDRGLGMPAAAVLVSPWVDVTRTGDTEFTLAHAEPNYLYEKHSIRAAAAYADPKDQKQPYVSPVYGDFTKGFPPTLIQGGTKETLLSGFIRLYQALDTAGQAVKLDLYEGMPHNFASRIPESPEARIARGKIRDFVHLHVAEEHLARA